MVNAAADEFTAIERQLKERQGLDLSRYKESYLRRRLLVRVRALKLPGLGAYARHLRRHPEEIGRLQRALSIKVTGLFRNRSCFAFLEEHVIPGIVERAARRGRRVDAWSAGCSTGEETYSLASLFAVAIEGKNAVRVRITGTDIDEAALTRCREARFPAAALAGTAPPQARRFFDPLPDGVAVPSRALRRMVRFEREDLMRPFARHDLDLILCRNVLIYFSLDHQETILSRFAAALSEGGSLMLGRVERLFGPARDLFDVSSPRDRVYRRTGAACE